MTLTTTYCQNKGMNEQIFLELKDKSICFNYSKITFFFLGMYMDVWVASEIVLLVWLKTKEKVMLVNEF